MKTLCSMLMLIWSCSAVASMLSNVRTLNPIVMSDLAVVSLSDAEKSARVAVLGDKAVVAKGVGVTRASAGRDVELLVIQHPSNGRYGTSDGGILVFLHAAGDLEGLAADYGLNIKDSLSSAPIGILHPADIETSVSFLEPLRSDPRVVAAQLDTNYYEVAPTMVPRTTDPKEFRERKDLAKRAGHRSE